MQNFIKPGNTMTFTAPTGGVVSGTPYLIGGLLVIATSSVAVGLQFEGEAVGVYSLPKAAGVWTEGAVLYWDNTAKNVTTTSTANFRIGSAAAVGGQLTGDTLGAVRLDGIAVTAVGGVAP